MIPPPSLNPKWPLHVPPGRGVKFSAQDRDTGLHSSTWLVKTSKNHDDVYLAEINSSGLWKTSHHNEHGVWRIAMTKEGAIELGIERQVASSWPMPAAEDGWIEGVAVLVSKQYLGPLTKALKDDIVVVPMSSSHNGIVVRLFFEELDAVPSTFPAAFPIAVLDRFGGGLVYVLAEPVEIEQTQLHALEAMCAEARLSIPIEQLCEQNRFVGVGTMDTRRLVIDLCVDLR